MQIKTPYERRIVYFMNGYEIDNLKYTDEGRELIGREEVMIVPVEEADNFAEHYQIMGGVLPHSGMMLTMSPHNPSVYSEIETCYENFATEKLTNILTLCHILGAKRVEIKNIFDELEKIKIEASAKGGTPAGGGSGGAKNERENSLKQQIGFVDEHTGGEADYDMAMAFLRNKRMAGDGFLTGLVEMRNPSYSKNSIVSKTMKFELNANMKSTFDLVAKLKVPAGGGEFKLKVENLSEKRYILEIKIDF